MANRRQRKKSSKINQGYHFPVGEKTLESYRREMKNTKSKIRRVKNQYNIDLEKEIPLPSLESFKTRKEFNQWVKEVQSFRSRSNTNYQYVKNPYGIVESKSLLNEVERLTKEAQKLADEKRSEFDDIPFFQNGEQYGTIGMQPGNRTGISRVPDFDFNTVRTKKRMKEIIDVVRDKSDPDYYDERNKRMRDNYILMLEKSFNSDVAMLVGKIKSIHPDEFYKMYIQIRELDFDVYYMDENTTFFEDGVLQKMLDEIYRFERGEYSKDMHHKNFS